MAIIQVGTARIDTGRVRGPTGVKGGVVVTPKPTRQGVSFKISGRGGKSRTIAPPKAGDVIVVQPETLQTRGLNVEEQNIRRLEQENPRLALAAKQLRADIQRQQRQIQEQTTAQQKLTQQYQQAAKAEAMRQISAGKIKPGQNEIMVEKGGYEFTFTVPKKAVEKEFKQLPKEVQKAAERLSKTMSSTTVAGFINTRLNELNKVQQFSQISPQLRAQIQQRIDRVKLKEFQDIKKLNKTAKLQKQTDEQLSKYFQKLRDFKIQTLGIPEAIPTTLEKDGVKAVAVNAARTYLALPIDATEGTLKLLNRVPLVAKGFTTKTGRKLAWQSLKKQTTKAPIELAKSLDPRTSEGIGNIAGILTGAAVAKSIQLSGTKLKTKGVITTVERTGKLRTGKGSWKFKQTAKVAENTIKDLLNKGKAKLKWKTDVEYKNPKGKLSKASIVKDGFIKVTSKVKNLLSKKRKKAKVQEPKDTPKVKPAFKPAKPIKKKWKYITPEGIIYTEKRIPKSQLKKVPGIKEVKIDSKQALRNLERIVEKQAKKRRVTPEQLKRLETARLRKLIKERRAKRKQIVNNWKKEQKQVKAKYPESKYYFNDKRITESEFSKLWDDITPTEKNKAELDINTKTRTYSLRLLKNKKGSFYRSNPRSRPLQLQTVQVFKQLAKLKDLSKVILKVKQINTKLVDQALKYKKRIADLSNKTKKLIKKGTRPAIKLANRYKKEIIILTGAVGILSNINTDIIKTIKPIQSNKIIPSVIPVLKDIPKLKQVVAPKTLQEIKPVTGTKPSLKLPTAVKSAAAIAGVGLFGSMFTPAAAVLLNKYLKKQYRIKPSDLPGGAGGYPRYLSAFSQGTRKVYNPDLKSILFGITATPAEKKKLTRVGRVFTGLERRKL